MTVIGRVRAVFLGGVAVAAVLSFSALPAQAQALEPLGITAQIGNQVTNWDDAATFEEWLEMWGLPPDTDPETDPLGKGMTYREQFIAGMNPLDPDSVFRFLQIKPEENGIALSWSGFSQRAYALERSSDLGRTWIVIEENIFVFAITPGPITFSYTDTTATGSGPYFYRVRVHWTEEKGSPDL
jgi:ABC-type transport system substrate-binding protein